MSSDANVGTSSVHPHGPENGTANGQSNHALSELNAEPIPRPTGTTDEVVNGVRRNGYVPANKHFVITSSLGKHLQSRGIGQGVRVKWISGGKIQHVNESIRAAEEQYKVISVLVGSNNISHQESAEECMERFSEVIDTVQRNQPNATLQFCRIPPRMNQERHNHKIVKLNDHLSKKCSESHKLNFIDLRIPEQWDFFDGSGVHLSPRGTARLGIAIKKSQPNLQRKTPGRDSDRGSNVDTGFHTPGLDWQPGQPEGPQRMPLVNQRNGSQRAPADDQHGRPQRVAEWPRSSWQQNERSLQNMNDASRASVSVNEWNHREPMPTYEWNYRSESVQRPPHRSPPTVTCHQQPRPLTCRRLLRVPRHEKLWNYVTWPAWENSNVFLFNWCLYSSEISDCKSP